MRVRTKIPFPYDARNLRAGEELDMPDDHANVLAIAGKVERVTETAPAADDEEIIDKRPRHRYGRRDMRAAK